MKPSFLKYCLAILAYLVPTMILGMFWHFIWFSALYDDLGIYNRKEPIIPLGFGSMLVQGCIIAYLYPYFAGDRSTLQKGLIFTLIMGLFLFSVSTLANAAKIQVTSMTTWLGIQFVFHLIQFTITGVLLGWVFRDRTV